MSRYKEKVFPKRDVEADIREALKRASLKELIRNATAQLMFTTAELQYHQRHYRHRPTFEEQLTREIKCVKYYEGKVDYWHEILKHLTKMEHEQKVLSPSSFGR